MGTPSQAYQLQKMQLETALRLLDERVASIQSAINNHTQVDTYAITKSLLAAKGYQFSTAELKDKLSNMQRRRREILAENDEDDMLSALSDERESVSTEIDAEVERVRAHYRQMTTAIENEARTKTNEIRATTSARIDVLDKKIEARKDAILNEEEPGLAEDLRAKEEQFPILKQTEEGLRGEVEKRADLVRQMRNALRSLVQDRVLSAKAHFTDSIAKNLPLDIEDMLKTLPDVSTMLNVMADPEELQKTVTTLSTTGDGFVRLALAAPAHPNNAEGD